MEFLLLPKPSRGRRTRTILPQGKKWRSVEDVLCKSARMMRRWKVLVKLDRRTELEHLATELEKRGTGPERITWTRSTTAQTSSSEASPLCPSQLGSSDVVDVGEGEVVSDALFHVAPSLPISVPSVEIC